MRRYTRKKKPSPHKKTLKSQLSMFKSSVTTLKHGLTIGDLSKIEGFASETIVEKIENYLLNQNKSLKIDNDVAKKLYKKTKRHSIHLDEILEHKPQQKSAKNTRLNRFIKHQNVVLNRLGAFRAQQYCSEKDFNFL